MAFIRRLIQENLLANRQPVSQMKHLIITSKVGELWKKFYKIQVFRAS
jgi:hypothetical protein